MSNVPNATSSDAAKTPNNYSNLVGDETKGLAYSLAQLSFETQASILPITTSNNARNDVIGQNDHEYENLDLNFDDLYVDGDEEEYFVQQSPLVTQFERAHDRTATEATASSCLSEIRRELENTAGIDDNEYYNFITATSSDDDESNNFSKRSNVEASKVNSQPTSSMTTYDEYSVCGEVDTYILGTLVIRVVAARGLSDNVIDFGAALRTNKQKKRSGTSNGRSDNSSLNPYASVRFNTLCSFPDTEGQHRMKQLNRQQVQRTSTIYSTSNPVWPRGENMYMDVSHPMPVSASLRGISYGNDGTGLNVVSGCASPTPLPDNQPADPGDPPLKVATASAKSRAKAAAKERLNLESGDKLTKAKNLELLPITQCILSPIVSCAIFHAPNSDSLTCPKARTKSSVSDDTDQGLGKIKKDFKNGNEGDSDDVFLGMASLDVTTLLTGKVAVIDEWLALSGDFSYYPPGQNSRQQRLPPSVRIVCEYEPTDIAPERGDYVQFTQFCHPADLYPLFNSCSGVKMFKVDAVYESIYDDNETYVEISTVSSKEGWVSTFLAHRNMLLLCREREQNMIEFCHDEFITHVERIGQSPLVETIQETVYVRVPDDGLIGVGSLLVKSAISTIFDRWLQNENTMKVVVDDLKFVTNWDGGFSSPEGLRLNSSPAETQAVTLSDNATTAIPTLATEHPFMNILEDDLQVKDEITHNSFDSTPMDTKAAPALPNMPPCPITGVPIRDPVVAADGHTYERAAIARWLQSNDMSPLTGLRLAHKNLVPNYMLLSSLQEIASSKQKPLETAEVKNKKVPLTAESSSSVSSSNIDRIVSVHKTLPITRAGNFSDDNLVQQTLISGREVDIRSDVDDKTTIDITIDD